MLKFLAQDAENTRIRNYFSNAVEKLKILEFEEVDPFPEKISYPIFAINFKYSKHPAPLLLILSLVGQCFNFHDL